MTSPEGSPSELPGVPQPPNLSRRVIAAMAGIVLASNVVFGSFVAENWGLYEFSPYHLLPSLLVCFVGAVGLLGVQRRGGDLDAAGVSMSIGALLAVGGGSLSDVLGPFAVLVVPLLVVFTYRLLKNVFAAQLLRRLGLGFPLALLLLFGFWATSVLSASLDAGQPEAQATPVADSEPVPAGSNADVFFIVLDELASTETAPLGSSGTELLNRLTDSGFQLHPTVWSGYTVSAAAIAAILDGSYPLVEGDYLDKDTLRGLGRITRGHNRLFMEARRGGYHTTMIESGLWMTSCDGLVDDCVESGVFDEALGVLLTQSAADWWYRTLWGDAMVQAGLRSIGSARDAMLALSANERADLLFAHVLLPHVPYVVDSDCELSGRFHESLVSREQRLDAYQRQAACVLSWLEATVQEVDAASEVLPTVVVVGDHGTNFAGQLTRPVEEWGSDEIVERLAAFSATRLPEHCSDRQFPATPQLTRELIDCLMAPSDPLPARHFLISYGDDPPAAVEYPHQLLSTAAQRR